MKSLFLLRGCPGAGKSTLAKAIGGSHVEADMFFLKENEYKFDPLLLKEAHEWCKKKVETAMSKGADKVVVSNTFTRKWEMSTYYELAEKYGFTVFSLIVENRHGGKNIHGVPDERILQMKERFEIVL